MSPSVIQKPVRPNSGDPPASFKSRYRRIVRNFTPSWFAITMGTGIIAVLLSKLPYNGTWLYMLSIIIFVLDIILFTLFCLISALRYIQYPEIWQAMLNHPTESLFLGTCPMSLGILIQMILNVCVQAWGPWTVTLAWTLWWIEVVASVAVCFYLPFTMMSVHKTDISSVTTLWLLPIVSAVICAATGAMVADALTNPAHSLWTLIISYILWGIGVPLAMFTLVLYYHRLTMHKLPPPAVISSVFLPLGPLGEGGFAIMKMGQVALAVFPETNTIIPSAGEIVYVFGFLTALLMWGFGLAWLAWALASFGRSKSQFNMGWWSIVFATGVFTGSTISLGQEMPSRFFDVLGTIFTVIIVLFWMIASVYTLRGIISGALFFSPALADLPDLEDMSTPEP
ncbi:putative C4-dicarboxylate transporter/malic acid transport protein [Halenospora varia]|nr:putative C4-dicarboxylate transporter/malic acid transport protein [Halenospora varia]